MKPFSFIHAADLHLGTPFSGLGHSDAGWQKTLVEAPFTAFRRIIDYCIGHEVDFLLLAGDVYDSSQQDLRAQVRLRDGLASLARHGIATYLIYGNHDHADQTGGRLRWPEQVHLFPAGSVGKYPVVKAGETVAEIYGISYPDQSVSENYLPLFKPEPNCPYSIGLLHANVGGAAGQDNYAPCSLTNLMQVGMDYWALGHVHTPTILSEQNPVIAYPGTPQGRSPRETGVKGCYLVEVDGTGTKTTFLPTTAVLWEELTVDISGYELIDDLLEGVTDQVASLHAAGSPALVLRLTLTGRGSLHHELRSGGFCDELLTELRSRSYPGLEQVWFDKITLQTAGELDHRELRKSDGLVADYLQILDALRQEAASGAEHTPLLTELYQVLAPLYQGRNKGHLQPLTGEDLLRLLAEVEEQGIDLLVGEEG